MGGAVTGHYAGPLTRLVAFIIDWILLLAIYGLILGGTSYVLSVIFGVEVGPTTDTSIPKIVGLAIWILAYSVGALTLYGRTVGKIAVGLRVVLRNGAPLTPGRATVRVLAFPLSFVIFGLGFLGILVGRERRALHDVIAGTAVVYDWGDRPAELPAPLTRWLERKQALRRTLDDLEQ